MSLCCYFYAILVEGLDEMEKSIQWRTFNEWSCLNGNQLSFKAAKRLSALHKRRGVFNCPSSSEGMAQRCFSNKELQPPPWLASSTNCLLICVELLALEWRRTLGNITSLINPPIKTHSAANVLKPLIAHSFRTIDTSINQQSEFFFCTT